MPDEFDVMPNIRVGVLLPHSAGEPRPDELDETGHKPAFGGRRRAKDDEESRIAVLGHQVLQAAANAIGHEVAFVVNGVVEGIEKNAASANGQISSYAIDNLEMTFGVKATLGAGKAVEAFLTASGEATVQVKLTLKRPAP
jgi:hypothetical protein